MKLVGILAIVAVLIAGFLFYSLFGANSDQSKHTQQSSGDEVVVTSEDSAVKEPETFAGFGTLQSVRLLGKNVECVIVYESDDAVEPVSGTYFVAGENVRGDFELNVPQMGGEFLTSIIVKDSMLYSWSEIDGQTQGIKISLEDADEGPVGAVTMDVDVDYTCSEWQNVDNSIFELPSDVLFRDPLQLIQEMEYGTIYEEGEF